MSKKNNCFGLHSYGPTGTNISTGTGPGPVKTTGTGTGTQPGPGHTISFYCKRTISQVSYCDKDLFHVKNFRGICIKASINANSWLEDLAASIMK